MSKQNLKKVVCLMVVVLSMTVLVGCSKTNKQETTSPVTSNPQAEIENIINQNPELFSVDQEETQESDAYSSPVFGSPSAPSSYLTDASSGTATLPVAWFRLPVGGRPDKNINIDVSGNFATVTITKNWLGKLYVDRTRDGRRNPGSKPIDDTTVKKAYFEQIYGIWTLTKISCVDIDLTDKSKQTVEIVSVTAKSSDGKTYTITDPLNMMYLSTELPTFAPGTKVTVEVKVTNSKQEWTPPVFVFMHHGQLWARHRDQMYDDGTHDDAVAGDGIYTNSWTIEAGDEVYRHCAVDILDSGCLQNETEDDYNSTAWRIPYKVQTQ